MRRWMLALWLTACVPQPPLPKPAPPPVPKPANTAAPVANQPPCTVKQRKLCERQCDAGNLESCSTLGVLLVDDALDVPGDPPRAAKLFRAACDGGHLGACVNLGTMLVRGSGIPKDEAAAEVLYARACDGKIAPACGDLGLWLLDKRPPDPVSAARYFEKGCELGAPEACISLGGMALKGTSPIDQNPKLARRLFAAACDMGHASGCFNVGLMYERALALPPDGDTKKARFQQACKLGHQEACKKASVGAADKPTQ